MLRNAPRFTLLLLTVGLLALTSCSPWALRPNLQYEKVPALGITGGPTKLTVLGGGLEAAGRMKPESKWGWNIGGSYSFGGIEFEDETSGDTDELGLKAYSIYGGFDYYLDVGDADIYCGPSLFYTSTTEEFEQTGFPSIELEPYNFIGIQNRFGLSKPIGLEFRF